MMLSSSLMMPILPSAVGYVLATCPRKSSVIARPIPILAIWRFSLGLQEEFHLDACKLDHVVVLQRVRRRPDLLAVDRRAARAFNVGDEVALRTPGQHRHLGAGLAERGERLRQLEFFAGIGAREELDRTERLAWPGSRRRACRRSRGRR